MLQINLLVDATGIFTKNRLKGVAMDATAEDLSSKCWTESYQWVNIKANMTKIKGYAKKFVLSSVYDLETFISQSYETAFNAAVIYHNNGGSAPYESVYESIFWKTFHSDCCKMIDVLASPEVKYPNDNNPTESCEHIIAKETDSTDHNPAFRFKKDPKKSWSVRAAVEYSEHITDESWAPCTITNSDSPLDILLAKEESENNPFGNDDALIAKCLEFMSQKQREVWELLLEGKDKLSLHKIAEKLGIDRGAVKDRRKWGIEKAKAGLQSYIEQIKKENAEGTPIEQQTSLNEVSILIPKAARLKKKASNASNKEPIQIEFKFRKARKRKAA